jgi:predicted transcriptional regulator
MTSASTTQAERSSNDVARRRDAQILWLLERHPATARMLAGIGLFPAAKKATRRLSRLSKRGLIRRLGTVSLKDGRPEHVYCRGRWKADNLLHEVQLTRVCLKMHAEVVRRGSREVDPFLRPDAELLIGGKRFFLEIDLGTMSCPDVVQNRFGKYRGTQDFVLWVCASARRMELLRHSAEVIREIALFTTLDLALDNPHAPIWVDFDGERAALPRTTLGTKRG